MGKNFITFSFTILFLVLSNNLLKAYPIHSQGSLKNRNENLEKATNQNLRQDLLSESRTQGEMNLNKLFLRSPRMLEEKQEDISEEGEKEEGEKTQDGATESTDEETDEEKTDEKETPAVQKPSFIDQDNTNLNEFNNVYIIVMLALIVLICFGCMAKMIYDFSRRVEAQFDHKELEDDSEADIESEQTQSKVEKDKDEDDSQQEEEKYSPANSDNRGKNKGKKVYQKA